MQYSIPERKQPDPYASIPSHFPVDVLFLWSHEQETCTEGFWMESIRALVLTDYARSQVGSAALYTEVYFNSWPR
jgi:hypothetical protein